MSVLYAQYIFDDAVSHLTTGASTHAVYLGPVVYDKALGIDLFLESIVTTAFTDSSSNSTMTVALQTKDEDGSYATVMTLGTFGALSPVNTKLKARINSDILTKPHARVLYTVANGDLTTAAFSTHLVFSDSKTIDYAVGVI